MHRTFVCTGASRPPAFPSHQILPERVRLVRNDLEARRLQCCDASLYFVVKNILLFTGGFVMYRKRHQHWMYPFKVVMTLYNVNTVPETVMKENTVKYTSGVCLEYSFLRPNNPCLFCLSSLDQIGPDNLICENISWCVCVMVGSTMTQWSLQLSWCLSWISS